MRIGIDATILHGQFSGVEHSVARLIRGMAAVDRDNEYFLYYGASSSGQWPESACRSLITDN